jgi:hypothetical protein
MALMPPRAKPSARKKPFSWPRSLDGWRQFLGTDHCSASEGRDASPTLCACLQRAHRPLPSPFAAARVLISGTLKRCKKFPSEGYAASKRRRLRRIDARAPEAESDISLADQFSVKRLSEQDLFAGINIKLIRSNFPQFSSNGDQSAPGSNQYYDRIRTLLSRYKSDFVDGKGSKDEDVLSPEEYPDDMPIDKRGEFGRKRCDCYYHYLKGKLADRLHDYREALEEFKICIEKDHVRTEYAQSVAPFYRPDYYKLTVLEAMVQQASSSTPLNQRPADYGLGFVASQREEDLKELISVMSGLSKLFSTNPKLQRDPGFLFVKMGSVEWCAFGADRSLADWSQVDHVYGDVLLWIKPQMSDGLYTLVQNSRDLREAVQALLAHRCALKTIYSGYQTNYFSSHVNRNLEYTKPEIDAVEKMYSIRQAFFNSASSKENWKENLESLKTKLATDQDEIHGIPLGILLRLREDIDEILSHPDSPFGFPERMKKFMNLKELFDPEKDEVEHAYVLLVENKKS